MTCWKGGRRQREEVRWARRGLLKRLRWRRDVAGGSRVDMVCIYGCSVLLAVLAVNGILGTHEDCTYLTGKSSYDLLPSRHGASFG